MKCLCPKKWQVFFRAIHDGHRQMILDIIRSHKEINAHDIGKNMSLSQPTISHHLKILTEASIVHAKKIGKEVIYSINESSIDECCSGFMDKFIQKKQ